jgi:hypothetical protein
MRERGGRGAWEGVGAWGGRGRAGLGGVGPGHFADQNPRHARPKTRRTARPQSRTENRDGTRRPCNIRQRNVLRHDATPMTLRFWFIQYRDTCHYTGLKLGRKSEPGREKRVTPEFGERKEEKILPPNLGRYSWADSGPRASSISRSRPPPPLAHLGPPSPACPTLSHHAPSLNTSRPHSSAVLRPALSRPLPLWQMGPTRLPFLLAHDLTGTIPADCYPPPSLSLTAITPAPVELGTASPPMHCASALTRQPAPSDLIPGAVRHYCRRCAPRRRSLALAASLPERL